MLKITIQGSSQHTYFKDLKIGTLFKLKDNFYIKCRINNIHNVPNIPNTAYDVKNHKFIIVASHEEVIPYEGELIIKHPLL